jgi:hypothetical protein
MSPERIKELVRCARYCHCEGRPPSRGEELFLKFLFLLFHPEKFKAIYLKKKR